MPNKTGRKELSSETIAIILTLHKLGYTALQISREEGLTKDIPKSTITFQIRRAKKHQNNPFIKAIRTGRSPKLDTRAERRLVRFMIRNPFETLTCLSTPGKSGYRIHINTTRKYLTKNEYYAFRPRRKPYLTEIYKKRTPSLGVRNLGHVPVCAKAQNRGNVNQSWIDLHTLSI
jgi:hypothetical protein